jgi:hypothetical protein
MDIYTLTFFVPQANCDTVLEAIFKTGAGSSDQYDQCCFRSEGTGQFRPLKGSQPFIGESMRLEKVSEIRVEMMCHEENLRAAVKALLDSHPYEEVAYHVVKLHQLEF